MDTSTDNTIEGKAGIAPVKRKTSDSATLKRRKTGNAEEPSLFEQELLEVAQAFDEVCR